MKKTIRILIFAIVISAVSGFGTVGLSNDTFTDDTKPVGDCDLVEYNGERYIKIKSYTNPDFITALKLKYTGHSETVARGDNIRAVSDPLKIENVFSDITDIPTSVFSSPESLATYLRGLNDADVVNQLSFYGREIRYPEGRNELMSVIIDLWYNHYNNNLEEIKSITSQTYLLTKSIWGNANNTIKFSVQGTLDFYTVYYDYYPKQDFTLPRYELTLQRSLFAPVYCGFENDVSDKPFSPVPAIVIKYIADKGNLQNAKNAFKFTVNAALFGLGVGEIVQGVRAGLIVVRTSGFLSTEMLLASGRITIGVADLAAFTTSNFCNNSNTEFCKDWKEYELYVNMGLLTTSLTANIIITKLRRSYTPSVKAGMTDDQIGFIENKLGIPVNTVGKQLDFSPSWLPNRTITGNLDNPKGLIGVYERQLPDGTWVRDTKNALESIGDFPVANTSNFRTVSKDGYKMLNTPQEFYQNADQFWTQYNKPWLDDLVSKKTDITILSDKSNDYLNYKWTKNSNTGQIEFDVIPGTSTRIKTGFGREVEYMENLVQQGKYEWDAISGVYKAL